MNTTLDRWPCHGRQGKNQERVGGNAEQCRFGIGQSMARQRKLSGCCRSKIDLALGLEVGGGKTPTVIFSTFPLSRYSDIQPLNKNQLHRQFLYFSFMAHVILSCFELRRGDAQW